LNAVATTDTSKPAPARSRLDPFTSRVVALTPNRRVPMMMQLVKAINRADDPREVVRVFGEGIQNIQPVERYVSLSTQNLEPAGLPNHALRTGFRCT